MRYYMLFHALIPSADVSSLPLSLRAPVRRFCDATGHIGGLLLPGSRSFFGLPITPTLWGCTAQKKILALDLDGTLIYASTRFPPEVTTDCTYTLYLPEPQKFTTTTVHDALTKQEKSVASGTAPHPQAKYVQVCGFHVWERPGLQLFLDTVSRWYEVVVFTAATKGYAVPLIVQIERSSTRRRIDRVYDAAHLQRCPSPVQPKPTGVSSASPEGSANVHEDLCRPDSAAACPGETSSSSTSECVTDPVLSRPPTSALAPKRKRKFIAALKHRRTSCILIDDTPSIIGNPENSIVIPTFFPNAAPMIATPASPRKSSGSLTSLQRSVGGAGSTWLDVCRASDGLRRRLPGGSTSKDAPKHWQHIPPPVLQTSQYVEDTCLLDLLPLLEALRHVEDVRNVLGFLANA